MRQHCGELAQGDPSGGPGLGPCSQRPERELGYAKAIGEKTGGAYEEVQRPEEPELGRWGWWGERNPLGQTCWEL